MPSDRAWLAVGVGHVARTATTSSRLLLCPFSTSIRTRTGRVMRHLRVGHVSCHQPEPVPLMRRPNIGSSQHCPPAVIPERGQVTEDSPKSSSKEGWTVLHEDVAGSNLANDARHVPPHPAALSVDSCTPPRHADVLAGKAARYDVNTAAPRSSVKGLNVIPDREGREKAVILSGGKNASCVGFPLNGADGSPSEQMASEYAATSACEKSQLIHGAPSSAMTSSTDCAIPATPPAASHAPMSISCSTVPRVTPGRFTSTRNSRPSVSCPR